MSVAVGTQPFPEMVLLEESLQIQSAPSTIYPGKRILNLHKQLKVNKQQKTKQTAESKQTDEK